MNKEAAQALATFQELLADNPHTGTAEQVVALSLAIAEASEILSATTFSLYRDESGLGEKVFSKLKVIGERLGQLDTKTSADVVKGLPDSYSTIYLLCGLKPEELVTAVKRKHVTPKTSVRAATAYIKQVRFPHQVINEAGKEQRHYFVSDETLYQICRPEHIVLDREQHLSLDIELWEICNRYGVELHIPTTPRTTALREADRREREQHSGAKFLNMNFPSIGFRRAVPRSRNNLISRLLKKSGMRL